MVVAVDPENMKCSSVVVNQLLEKAIPGFIKKGKTNITKLFSTIAGELHVLARRPDNATNIDYHFDEITQGLS